MLFHLKLRHSCDSLVGENGRGQRKHMKANSEAVAYQHREKQCGDSEGVSHSGGLILKYQECKNKNRMGLHQQLFSFHPWKVTSETNKLQAHWYSGEEKYKLEVVCWRFSTLALPHSHTHQLVPFIQCKQLRNNNQSRTSIQKHTNALWESNYQAKIITIQLSHTGLSQRHVTLEPVYQVNSFW